MRGGTTLLYLFVYGLVNACFAVDRGNFKTCQQSGFCKRQRGYDPDESPYKAILDTATVQNSKITVEVLNTRSQIKLTLEVSAIVGNIARVKINELQPLKPRYEIPVGDSLVKEPALDKLLLEKDTEESVTLAFSESNKIVVQSKPFRIDFFAGGEPVVTINSAGLLKFEHLRQKNEPGVLAGLYNWVHDSFRGGENEAGDPNALEEDKDGGDEADDFDEADEADESDMWEEKFKTHTDTKPNGPSSVGVDISFPGYEFVYGIPEHADSLALKSTKNGEPYRLYNLDVFEYDLNNPMALYGSVPVMYAHNTKRTVGVFWHNAAETWVDISSNTADKSTFSKLVDFVKGDQDIPQVDTHWISESGVIDVFVMLGPSAADTMRQYASLAGTTALPPLFALAYHQSRWNYNDEQDVANVNAGFDTYDIPMDVLWLDIEHADGKRYFTWDAHKFPHSVEMINNVSAVGRKMVTIIDPHIKKDGNYRMYQEGKDLGYFIKDKDGNEYEGWCWPGSSGWLDFVDPKIREFWARKFLLDDYEGSTLDLYTWNDMNEPSVFNGPEITMHKDAKHFGDWEHRDVHNIYGGYVHRATYEGHLLRAENQRRPFVLSRAFFAGSHRYGAIWTGDNTADWGHLKISLPMLLSLNLVGFTFSGADIGGFFKNPEPELLTRWYQAAVYQPFVRAHAHLDTKRREPWLLPEENTRAVREALRARYSLLPYWYTLFAASEKSGEAVMKPLWVDFPGDRETFTIDDQHLVGNAFLVHPVTDHGAAGVQVYLPGANDVWYDVDTHKMYTGKQRVYIPTDIYKIPVFQRGGTIVPRKERIRRSSSLTYHDPYTLVVALDKQGTAEGTLYMDEYDSFSYQQGVYALRKFSYSNNQLLNRNGARVPTRLDTRSWVERVVVVGLPRQPASVTITGTGLEKTVLESTYTAETKSLVIRKPGAHINSDFTITLQ